MVTKMTLRKQIIKLAHANPEFRKDLLPLLKEAQEDAPEYSEDWDEMEVPRYVKADQVYMRALAQELAEKLSSAEGFGPWDSLATDKVKTLAAPISRGLYRFLNVTRLDWGSEVRGLANQKARKLRKVI